MTIYLLNYNNYYNRQVKKFDTIEEYEAIAAASYVNYNFIPGDGITTRIIVNYSLAIVPNYLVVYDADNDEIVSRWFIIDHNRTRSGQYELSLFRDTIVDHYDEVINAPVFIEKATLNMDNPLIWNPEEFSVNQIKQSEFLLTDETETPWIVAYLAKGTNPSGIDPDNITADFKYVLPADITYTNITAEDIYKYSNLGDSELISPSRLDTRVRFDDSSSYSGGNFFDINGNDFSLRWDITQLASTTGGYSLISNITGLTNEQIQQRIQNRWTSAQEAIVDDINDYNVNINKSKSAEILLYNGKIIFDEATSKYYKVSITERKITDYTMYVDIPSGDLFNTLKEVIDSANLNIPAVDSRQFFSGEANAKTFSIIVFGSRLDVKLNEMNLNTGTINIPRNNKYRIPCWDAPYDIICAPFADFKIYKTSPDSKTPQSYIQRKDVTYQAMMALTAATSGGDNPEMYDIQLLPYCPITYVYTNDGIWAENNTYGNILDANNTEIGRVFFAPSSQFSFNIEYEIDTPTSAIEYKIENQCDMYRICSPNYNGVFEFNPLKNNGVSYFNVDCTYKPYQPYIHINPNFGGLYGQDFNDSRGLICGGDFSLPTTSNAWATYERQNKNYQQLFDRQIENLEITQKYQMTEALANTATGTLQGGAGGAMAGSIIPGVGTAAGAVIGTAASAIGGIADVYILNQMQKETLDYTKDQFGYQLGNIKALPYSLTRNSAYNLNNKIFPFLEYYTCTDIEKEALREKLKYNGMSVGVIGNISNYQQAEKTYIKGKLIRIENFSEDYHILSVIADELNKGVFI